MVMGGCTAKSYVAEIQNIPLRVKGKLNHRNISVTATY